MYSLEIELTIAATDANKILGVNKFAKHKIFEAVKREVSQRVLIKPKEPLKKFKLSAHRYSSKTLDYDNFIGSLKPVIDGLRLAGVIYDDSWGYIQSIATQQTISKEKKLVIKVEEVSA